MNAKAKQAFKWIAIAVACFIGALAIALALMDWNALKRPIERIASARSGRYVSLGRVEVHIFSSAPNVTAEGVVIGNPPWEPARRMLEVERVRLQLRLLPLLRGDVILPRLELRRPRLY